MNEADLTTLLRAERSGGSKEAHYKTTGQRVNEVIEIEVPDVEAMDPARAGHVSAQLELSRSSHYNKISVTLRASGLCSIGDESNQAQRLLQALHEKASEYVDVVANPTLRQWGSE